MILARLAIVFTHAEGRLTPEDAKERANEIADKIREITGVPVSTFPVYQLDCGIATRPGSTPEYIEERKTANRTNLDLLTSWVRLQKPIPTADFKIGEYQEMKRLREENQKRVAAEVDRDKAVTQAEAEALKADAAMQRAREADAARLAAEQARLMAEQARNAAEQRARAAEASAAARKKDPWWKIW